MAKNQKLKINDKNQVVQLLQRFADAGLGVIKTENLYNFDDRRN